MVEQRRRGMLLVLVVVVVVVQRVTLEMARRNRGISW